MPTTTAFTPLLPSNRNHQQSFDTLKSNFKLRSQITIMTAFPHNPLSKHSVAGLSRGSSNQELAMSIELAPRPHDEGGFAQGYPSEGSLADDGLKNRHISNLNVPQTKDVGQYCWQQEVPIFIPINMFDLLTSYQPRYRHDPNRE